MRRGDPRPPGRAGRREPRAGPRPPAIRRLSLDADAPARPRAGPTGCAAHASFPGAIVAARAASAPCNSEWQWLRTCSRARGPTCRAAGRAMRSAFVSSYTMVVPRELVAALRRELRRRGRRSSARTRAPAGVRLVFDSALQRHAPPRARDVPRRCAAMQARGRRRRTHRAGAAGGRDKARLVPPARCTTSPCSALPVIYRRLDEDLACAAASCACCRLVALAEWTMGAIATRYALPPGRRCAGRTAPAPRRRSLRHALR